MRKLTIIIGEVATLLEKLSEVPVTDWMAIGDAIIHKLERVTTFFSSDARMLPFLFFNMNLNLFFYKTICLCTTFFSRINK